MADESNRELSNMGENMAFSYLIFFSLLYKLLHNVITEKLMLE